jgi:hypothetical protein
VDQGADYEQFEAKRFYSRDGVRDHHSAETIMSITVPRPSRRSLLLAALTAAPTFAGHLLSLQKG